MNTTPGMYFQLAVSANNATAPHTIQPAAITNRSSGRDGRRPIWGVGAGGRGGRPEPPVDPPFGVTRPPFGVTRPPVGFRPLDMVEKLVGHGV